MENIFNMFGGMPHGMPHGMPQMRQRQSPQNTDNSELYEILGIPKNADKNIIRKAYLKKSRVGKYRHPDKGGTEENFKKLSLAYNTLKDPEKKTLYDKYGNSSLKSTFREPMSGFSDIFGMRKQRKKEIKKGKPTIFNLKCTLEELCSGKTKKIKVTRTVIVDRNNELCNSPVSCCDKCEQCDGNGSINEMRRIGPGMIQQLTKSCRKCNGSGNGLRLGYTLKKKTEIIEIFVEKGSNNGDKIKIDSKGNMSPGNLTSDIVVVINETNHKMFRRKGDDLLLKKEITLIESLCGFKFIVKHPDKRKLVIKSNEIVKENNVKCVETGGMPLKEDPYSNGKLFIVFSVIYPQKNELNKKKLIQLRKIFEDVSSFHKYKRYIDLSDENIEEHELTHVNPEIFGRQRKNKSAHDSDSDEDRDGERCRTM